MSPTEKERIENGAAAARTEARAPDSVAALAYQS